MEAIHYASAPRRVLRRPLIVGARPIVRLAPRGRGRRPRRAPLWATPVRGGARGGGRGGPAHSSIMHIRLHYRNPNERLAPKLAWARPGVVSYLKRAALCTIVKALSGNAVIIMPLGQLPLCWWKGRQLTYLNKRSELTPGSYAAPFTASVDDLSIKIKEADVFIYSKLHAKPFAHYQREFGSCNVIDEAGAGASNVDTQGVVPPEAKAQLGADLKTQF
ncbi:hypothetical protein EVAR_60595_1 [Eumeta japonica]|uniref:Uncharacterized protein n=1 Tax=Eumeta variegata TaxID=151549 RepID=A0A4C1YAL8_EUMVA|nr:hypothetical protein EVAR_60595_1 [Eumeta japonica]